MPSGNTSDIEIRTDPDGKVRAYKVTPDKNESKTSIGIFIGELNTRVANTDTQIVNLQTVRADTVTQRDEWQVVHDQIDE